MSSKNQVFLKKFCYKNNMIDKKSLRNRFSRYYPISGIEDISGIAGIKPREILISWDRFFNKRVPYKI